MIACQFVQDTLDKERLELRAQIENLSSSLSEKTKQHLEAVKTIKNFERRLAAMADENEKLKAQLAQAIFALEPFAVVGDDYVLSEYEAMTKVLNIESSDPVVLTVGHCRAARCAIDACKADDKQNGRQRQKPFSF